MTFSLPGTAAHAILFFRFNSLLFVSLSIILAFHPKGERESKGAKVRPKKRKLHELLYTGIVKSGSIRLASDVYYFIYWLLFLRVFVNSSLLSFIYLLYCTFCNFCSAVQKAICVLQKE